ncbi:MAG TPA: phosphoribosylanthranilate isomerase [Acidimicrobiia bacterium]|nr:phosphoribosylanthranilate isomerase [Acidimicrobiia bacterium]
MFVKICGVTTEEDALLAVAMGADAVGFVFAPSRRQVRPDDVRDIVRRLPPEVVTVGVFRNERPETVCDVVNRIGLRAAQLHGGETLTEVTYVRERVPMVLQAFPAGDPRLDEASKSPADVILVDSRDPGSGTVFDWSLVEGVPPTKPMLLAGGLTPDNVETAIQRVQPWGVDVATGVEHKPGRKDPTKVRRFIEAANRAFDALGRDDEWQPSAEPPYDWMADR